jgi:hypothetical protein
MRITAIIIFFLTFFTFVGAENLPAKDWQELKGDHFIVYYKENLPAAKELLYKAERYYRRIAPDLGYPRYSDFWTWDNRVIIYMYPDKESYAEYARVEGHPDWAVGMADYVKRTITSYVDNRRFIDSVLPHEITHLIFRDFVGFTGKIPVWLDEGVAQWEEGQATQNRVKEMVKDLWNKDSLLNLDDIFKIDLRYFTSSEGVYIRPTTTKKGEPGIVFLSGANLVTTYYVQSAALVGFLIEKYGSQRFSDFCRQLRDGKTVDAAITNAYSGYIRDMKDLEKKLRQYIKEEF